MDTVNVKLIVLLLFVLCIEGAEDGPCRLVDDHSKKNLNDTLCYVKCLSDALNKLYTDGERKLLLNEEVYANASRILDDMEGKTGESVRYLSVISGLMEGRHDKLEKLISYGNEMGDLVAKMGGYFAEVNESVRAVRKKIPDALIKANRYYTAIAEITRTVWNDVKAVEAQGDGKCKYEKYVGVDNLPKTCDEHTCPLKSNVSDSVIQEYEDGCLEINVLNTPGMVSECLNLPRNNLYSNGVVKNLTKIMEWKGEYEDEATRFQLRVQVQKLFGPLIAPFASGLPPFVILDTMNNITSLYSHFIEVNRNFTSLLLGTNGTKNESRTNSTI